MTNGMRARRLSIEGLESRELLAAYVIESGADTSLGQALVSAIELSNSTQEADTITLPQGFVDIPEGAPAISGELSIFGSGPGTQIGGSAGHRIFSVLSGSSLSLSQMHLIGGEVQQGGALLNAGELQLRDVSIVGGSAERGGAIFNSGHLVISNAAIANSIAVEGGAIYNTGSVLGDQVAFVGNRASGGQGGGAVNNQGLLDLTDSVLVENESIYFGGAISTAGVVRLSSTAVTSNVSEFGSGIAILGGQYSGQVSTAGESIIAGNSAGELGVNDIAQFDVGSAGALLSPLLSAEGSVEAADAAINELYQTLDSPKFSELTDLRGANFEAQRDQNGEFQVVSRVGSTSGVALVEERYLLISLPVESVGTLLPSMSARAPSWDRIVASQAGSNDLSFSYDGNAIVFELSELGSSPNTKYEWADLVVQSVNSSAGSSVLVNNFDTVGVQSTTLRYLPSAGFSGSDLLTVTAVDAEGLERTGTIDVEVFDDITGKLQVVANESSDGTLDVQLEVPGNGVSQQVRTFSLVVSYDTEVMRFNDVAAVSPAYRSLSSVERIYDRAGQVVGVELSGFTTNDPTEIIATLQLQRIAQGNAMIEVRPEFGWSFVEGVTPLSPKVVDVEYDRFRPYDVNRDGEVTAVDALQIINALNSQNSPSLSLDVSGDADVTSLDALQVINYLNAFGPSGEPLVRAQVSHTTDLFSKDDEDERDQDGRIGSLLF
ncbi:MAG: hypothetical protein Rhob2KO_49400 [Rhodopirellula baltica]